eukprot:777307-Lingulodinium_polyedra.AAC.1
MHREESGKPDHSPRSSRRPRSHPLGLGRQGGRVGKGAMPGPIGSPLPRMEDTTPASDCNWRG